MIIDKKGKVARMAADSCNPEIAKAQRKGVTRPGFGDAELNELSASLLHDTSVSKDKDMNNNLGPAKG